MLTLFLELGIALLAYIELCTVHLHFVKALYCLSLADRTCCSTLISQFSDASTSMCF